MKFERRKSPSHPIENPEKAEKPDEVLTEDGSGLEAPTADEIDPLEAEGEKLALQAEEAEEEAKDADEKKIGEALSNLLGLKLNTHVAIDENLLGGYKVKVKDKVYDSSIRSQLDRLEKSLVG